MQFTLGKDHILQMQQPLRSDGFHYTHQTRDREFEDGLRGMMQNNAQPPISEGAYRESNGGESIVHNNLNDSQKVVNYALRVSRRF